MARTPERQVEINKEVWDNRTKKLQREELKSRIYEQYSLKVPVTTIAEQHDMRPLDVYKMIKEAIKEYALPKGVEATAKLAGYAEAALTSLEPKVSEGSIAAHSAANKWVRTLMDLYGIGPQAMVEITNNTVHINAEDLPVMQSLDVFRTQNAAIEGELTNGSE